MDTIKLPTPSLALNANKAPGHPYKMTYDDTVYYHETAKDIIGTVKRYAAKTDGGYLQSLVINAHGGPAEIDLGTGFGMGNTAVFDDLFVDKKPIVCTIYLVVCWVALNWKGKDGNIFCCRMAKNAHAYVVAPRLYQTPPSRATPRYHIDEFEDDTSTPDGKSAELEVLKYNPDGSNQIWNGVPVHVARKAFS